MLRPPSAFRWVAVLSLAILAPWVQAAELEDVQQLLLTGKYSECVTRAQNSIDRRLRADDWPVLQSQALLALGRYAEARTAISNALDYIPFSVRLRLQAREVYLHNGQTERAAELLQEINQLGGSRMWAFANEPKSLVALGRAALFMGADAKLVMENFLNRAKTADPNSRDTHLALGQLALDKYDDELAAKTFEAALKIFPEDPDINYGLARAHLAGDRAKMIQALETALGKNPNHTPSLLLQAEHLIDGEHYTEAEKLLDRVLQVNPSHPEAWAFRAVLAQLRSQPAAEQKARGEALKFWKTNPRVDHLIGLKLSQKYRFAEGSAYQRRALNSDSNYLPARLQLAQDLLRLGDETEGWKLAEAVHERDGYDVVAYNLMTLRDNLAGYTYVTNANFALKMTPHEAAIYGPRALAVLQRAYDTLGPKYGYKPTKPTLVEIFPEQKDFAIRTFAMPGGEGFLAVCFGDVITVNSPGQGAPANWEAVLWHEFCHVITLGLTKNKMPRWLSEGISVFEERQQNAAWGQAMTPKYRELILEGKLKPVGNLSAAFLTAKNGQEMQFAYFQSSLVVEYLAEKYGLEAVKGILRDLGAGLEINAAIAKNTAPLEQVEKEFTTFAKARAAKMGGELEWTRPQAGRLAAGDATLELHPKNFYRLTREAKKLIGEKKWEEAKAPIETILTNHPAGTGGESALALLAAVHRGLKEPEQERAALQKLAAIDATAVDAYTRLMELNIERKDWAAVAANAELFLGVNPLVPLPYQFVARAAEELGKPKDAIAAYRTLLRLDPPDPTDVHFRLAKLLRAEGDPAAKRHVLQALEEAPRYRDALKLLVELNGAAAGNTDKPKPAGFE